MERVEEQLEDLPCRGGLGPLPEPILEALERGGDGGAEALDLVPELGDGGAHPGDGGVDVDEAGGEADEVGVVAVDEVEELGLEGGEVVAELAGEGVEGDEGAEGGEVGVGVEGGGEEGGGVEPERGGLAGISAEQIRHC